MLHDGRPVRFWDHDLGPDRPRLLAGAPRPDGAADLDRPHTRRRAPRWRRPATTSPRTGRRCVTTWRVDEPYGQPGASSSRSTPPARTAAHRVLLDDPDHTVEGPVAVSPDGRWVACVRDRRTTATRPPDARCVVVPLDGGEPRDVAPGWDRWVTALAWTPDAAALVVAADDPGRAPLFRVDLATGTVTRLTGDDGAYSDPVVAPDGTAVYALRSAVDAPPAPSGSDPHAPDQRPTPLPAPGRGAPAAGHAHRGHGHGRRRHAAARPGSCCPTARRPQAPAPLLLWIHGGPLSSWNGWHWRWNPWVMAAHGYAVLLPDPALSTGYGQRVHRPRLGPLGRRALHRPHGAHRRRAAPPGHRREPHGRDGRLVRRLPGQLGRRAHRPLHRRSSPTRACGRSTSSRPPPTAPATGCAS